MRLLAILLAAEAALAVAVATPSKPDVVLLRVFVSESGWDSPADQHGILAVLERIGGSSPDGLVRGARLYSPRTFPVEEHPTGPSRRSERQQWVNELDETCSMPPSLRGVSEKTWHYVYRRRCLTLLQRARRYLTGWRDPECWASTQPQHWGGAMDDHRAVKAMWAPVHVQCGDRTTVNHFWCDPRKRGCYDEVRR